MTSLGGLLVSNVFDMSASASTANADSPLGFACRSKPRRRWLECGEGLVRASAGLARLSHA